MSQVGACQFMTNKNFESISALLDDELTSTKFESTFEQMTEQQEQVEAFSRYSLIGDVMRQEQELSLGDDFANNIQQAIASVEQDQSSIEQSNVVGITSHPSWGQKVVAQVKSFAQSSTGKGMSQFAIAASVALVAVVGVGNMSGTSTEQSDQGPAVITSPLIGGVTPVSVASDTVQSRQSENQKTQSRINALISDHQQQLRVADDNSEEQHKQDKDELID